MMVDRVSMMRRLMMAAPALVTTVQAAGMTETLREA
jgi:hypothetical protein